MRRGIWLAFKHALISILVLMTILVIALGAAWWFGTNHPKLSYRSVDYDIAIQPNGDLTVTQHIDVKLGNRGKDQPWKQLYQSYKLNEKNLSAIRNISVKNVTTGETYAQITDPAQPDSVKSDDAWNSRYAKHWYVAITNTLDTGTSVYKPETDGIPIYRTRAEYRKYDQGQVGKRIKDLEIGWNIPATRSARSMKFDVTMTFVGVTTLYKDIASFQWEPIAKDNTVPVGKVTGTVRFPAGITTNNSWGWLHVAGGSSTSRGEDGSLRFTANNVRAGQYLDIVAAYDASVVRDTSGGIEGQQYTPVGDWIRRSNSYGLADLQQSERTKEAKARARQRAQLIEWAKVFAIGMACALTALIASLAIVIVARRMASDGDTSYNRDVPKLDPASAARIASMLGIASSDDVRERQVAAVLLSLASKKMIAIYPGPASIYEGVDLTGSAAATQALALQAMSQALNGSENAEGKVNAKALRTTSTIVILRGSSKWMHLHRSEKSLLALLAAISKRIGSNMFDMQQMKQACKGWDDGYQLLDDYRYGCQAELNEAKAVRSTDWVWTFACLAPLYAVMVFMLYWKQNMALVVVLVFPVVVLIEWARNLAPSEMLTKRGAQQYGKQVLGFCRYLADFSDFSDRGAVDLALWNQYLVYATAMGMSKRTLRELAKAYPQIQNPDWLDGNATDSLVYWNFRYGSIAEDFGVSSGSGKGLGSVGDSGQLGASFGGITDFGAQLGSGFNEISATIRGAAPASMSGGGSSGSFSDGGGFDGGGGGSGGGSFGGR